MANIIYSKMVEKNEPMYGKFIHPIKMCIENESNACEKNEAILKALFNVEKSTRYAESFIGESDFDVFQGALEGAGAENDSIGKTFEKTIQHHQFMKEFTITKEMMDDSKFGIAADAKRRAEAFTRAYYKTRTKLACSMLINGTKESYVFAKTHLEPTTFDGKPLFHNAHTYSSDKMKGQTQSNYFSGNFKTVSDLEIMLNKAANKLRNMKDENGETLEYVADTIIIPTNKPDLEAMVKKVCGSERTVGSNNNDINTQYGNWSIIVLPNWETDDNRFMIMSSEANKNLSGNMFFDRVPLDISTHVDQHTRNLVVNGYSRMGVGITTYKHIALVVPEEVTTGTPTNINPSTST